MLIEFGRGPPLFRDLLTANVVDVVRLELLKVLEEDGVLFTRYTAPGAR